MAVEHGQNCNALNCSRNFENLENTEDSCCKEPLGENELELMDKCFNAAAKLSEIERSSQYFISGYVCHDEKLQTAVPPSLVECSSSSIVGGM